MSEHEPQTTRIQLPLGGAGEWTIGRADDCDIVIDAAGISERHAVLMLEDGTVSIADSGSFTGIYVNGARVSNAQLREGDAIYISPMKVRLEDHELVFEAPTPTDGFRVEAAQLRRTAGSVTLVDDVSLSILPGELVAMIGPSGSGKSSLLTTLAGANTPEAGAVLYDGEDLYDNLGSFRPSIGFVPQFPTVHEHLTVRQTLEFESALRLPETAKTARREAIAKALATVSIGHRLDARISTLSGGERKRLAIAIELLTDPRVLWLDEPTTGLDPHLHRHFMELFRELADTGMPVIVVSHDVDGIELCDRLVFVADGGVVYDGAPEGAPGHFAVRDITECYAVAQDAPDFARNRYRSARREAALPVRSRRAGAPRVDLPKARRLSQLRIKTRRNVALLFADRRNLLTLLLQAPLIGVLLAAVLASGAFEDTAIGARKLVVAAFALSLTMVWFGLINSVREFSKEQLVWRRERMTGAAVLPYLLSKAIVQWALVAAQAFILVGLVGLLRVGFPLDGIVVHPGWLELVVTLTLTGMAASSIGMLVSASVGNEDRGSSLVPYLIIPQFLACGVVFELPSKLAWLAMSTLTYWSTAAAGSTLDACSREFIGGPTCADALRVPLDHDPTTIALYWSALGGAAVVMLAITGMVLMLRDRSRHL